MTKHTRVVPSKQSPRGARLLWLLLTPLLALAMLGCSAQGDSAQDIPFPRNDPQVGDIPEQVPEEEPADSETDDGTRYVVRSGMITVRVKDVTAAAAQLRTLAHSHDGLVTNEYISTGEIHKSSFVELSIPSQELDTIMDAAAEVGELESRSIVAEDVTGNVVDLESRIQTLRDSIQRLRGLMEQSGSVGDIAKVEAELTARQSELEALLAQQKYLQQSVEQATVSVTLLGPSEVATPNPILEGLQSGWSALLTSISMVLTLAGGLLPFLLLAALVAIPLWLRWKKAAPARAAKAEQQAARIAAQQQAHGMWRSTPAPASAEPSPRPAESQPAEPQPSAEDDA
ncbi:MAG: DUF4349 domain-containing protein [Arachnia sp.]